VILVENRVKERIHKLILSTLLGLLSVSSVSADTISKEKIELAARYIDTLPRDTKILVWPTWRRSYEILGREGDIDQSIEKYKGLGSRPFYLSNFWGHRPQISMISISSNHAFSSEIGTVVARSSLLPSYKELLLKASLSNDGCTAYKFTSRHTWASIGIIIIGLKEIEKAGVDALDQCIQGALDYINGFPLPSKHFYYSLLPDSEVRGLIMEAIGQCAKEGVTEIQPPETTRDGVTALPSLSCVKSKIGQ
jgi:hypothetical protein